MNQPFSPMQRIKTNSPAARWKTHSWGDHQGTSGGSVKRGMGIAGFFL